MSPQTSASEISMTESALPSMARPRLLAIFGATGTGKSDLSLALADRLAGAGERAEIINADAMQLYRGMDIGTAKLTEAERSRHPHHLFDILTVRDEAAVARFQPAAREIIDAVLARGAWPILVGGSGLYVSSVIFEFDFPGQDPAIRARLESELEATGVGTMYRRLRELSAEAAEKIGPHNARRIVRALEVAEITGSPLTGMLPDVPVPWRPQSLIGLTSPREVLTARLDARAARMWQDGLLDEVRRLLDEGLEDGVTASRAIGYAQAIAQLRGEIDEAEAIELTQSLTRRYARRQVSWFKRYLDVHWADTHESEIAQIADRLVLELDLPRPAR